MITNKLKNLLLFLIMCGCFLLFFTNTRVITDVITDTLKFCVNKLIPSIFPFMVLTAVFSQINFKIDRNRAFLGINNDLFKVIAFSWLSGFIVGPKQLSRCVEDSDITSYALLSSNAGIGFVISYIGLTLWDNIIFGIFLFFVQISTSIAIFNLSKKKNKFFNVKSKNIPVLSAISDSILQSTNSMLSICGFTVFFVVVKQLICSVMKIHTDGCVYTTISVLTEISSGALASVHNKSNLISGFFSGFCIGFGGICMCMQTFAVCENNYINRVEFVIKKLIQGVICGIFCAIYVMANNLEPSKNVYLSFSEDYCLNTIIINTVFFFTILLIIKNYLKKKLISI